MGVIFGVTLLIISGVASIIMGIIFFTDHDNYSWISALLIPVGMGLLIISAWRLDKLTSLEDYHVKIEEQLPSIEEGYNYCPYCGKGIN